MTRSRSAVQACCQGQAWGRCSVSRRAEVAIRAGTWIRVRRTVAVVARARRRVPVRVAAARVRLNAMTASTSQAELAAKDFDGKCARARVLQVGVDLFDDGVGAVDLVGGDGVREVLGCGGEEGVMPPQLEQAVLAGALLLLRVGVGDPPHDQPARNPLRLLLRGERDVGTSATCAVEIQVPESSSKNALGYSIVVQASSAMLLMAALTRASRRTVTEASAQVLTAAPMAACP